MTPASAGRLLSRASLALALALAGCRSPEPSVPAPAPPAACTGCHASVTGLEAAHAALPCQACHGGETGGRTPEAAHRGLISIPGNAADMEATCGAPGCHPEMPPRLRASIMNTMAGVIAVDRTVFGEPNVGSVGEKSPADTHLRGLCLSCHLSAPKTTPGPIDESARGGACNACHLVYDTAAQASLGRPSTGPFAHPQLAATPTDTHCFGCHSRSGRISLHAAGLREARAGEPVARTLADGRALTAVAGDLHTAAGFLCVDCHPSWEVMGDARPVARREDQQRVQCEDCHLGPQDRAVAAVPLERLDPETRRLATRAGLATPDAQFVRYDEHGFAFPNVRLESGRVQVHLKGNRRVAEARPPAAACDRGGAHARVACATCHDAWAPHCIGCHTAWNPAGTHIDLLDDREKPGEWVETPGDVLYDRPVLGVRTGPDGGVARYEGFVPGMILTIAPTPGGPVRFQRRLAPITAHTTQRAARTCAECHADPLALGYGRGRLALARDTRGRPAWKFESRFPPRPEDGLPADAWVGFAQPGDGLSTRTDARSLNETERRRLLRVGACLTCHAPETPVMRAALADFAATDARRTKRCRVPPGP